MFSSNWSKAFEVQKLLYPREKNFTIVIEDGIHFNIQGATVFDETSQASPLVWCLSQ